jgi:hypothetical protein
MVPIVCVLSMMCVVALSDVACTPSVLVPCKELRGLQLGMSRADAISRLGAPKLAELVTL